MCPGVCPDQAAAWEVLTRRHRQLVSSLIPQDKLVSAELGLVLNLIRKLDRLNPSQDGPGFDIFFVLLQSVGVKWVTSPLVVYNVRSRPKLSA